jgi:energy-coupling factor transporter transmembrane protein EcfT
MNETRRQRADPLWLLLAGVTFLGTAALVFYLRLPRPFVWIWLSALLVCLFIAARASGEWLRRLSLLGFGLALSLLLLEGVFAIVDKLKPGGAQVTGTYADGDYFVQGGELGYGPMPGARVTSRKAKGKQLVYDVAYTISDHGVRVTKGDPNGDTWLFMGDSNMFGEGVNDDETLPAYFSAALDYRANVINLGFHGYGPQQMLRSLETDRIRPLVHGAVKQVIYEGMLDHPWRAAGHDDWDVYGPSYALSRNGVTYTGPFHGRYVGFALKVLQKSDFFHFVLDRTLYRFALSDEDIERYARILERSAQLARSKYASELTVLFWDDDNEESRRIVARLRKTAIPLVPVSDIIPRSEWKALELPGDPHPSPEVHRRLAAALVSRFQAGATVGH